MITATQLLTKKKAPTSTTPQPTPFLMIPMVGW